MYAGYEFRFRFLASEDVGCRHNHGLRREDSDFLSILPGNPRVPMEIQPEVETSQFCNVTANRISGEGFSPFGGSSANCLDGTIEIIFGILRVKVR